MNLGRFQLPCNPLTMALCHWMSAWTRSAGRSGSHPHLSAALCLWISAWAAGCGGILKQPPLAIAYFSIDAGRPETTAATTAATRRREGVLRVDHLRIGPQYDDVRLVYRIGPSQFDRDDYNNFIAPPAALMTGSLIQWLDQSGPLTAVSAASPLRSKLKLEGEITALYVDSTNRQARTAVVAGRFFLLRERGSEDQVEFEMPFDESVPVATQSPAGFATALGQAWRKVLEKLTAKLAESSRDSE